MSSYKFLRMEKTWLERRIHIKLVYPTNIVIKNYGGYCKEKGKWGWINFETSNRALHIWFEVLIRKSTCKMTSLTCCWQWRFNPRLKREDNFVVFPKNLRCCNAFLAELWCVFGCLSLAYSQRYSAVELIIDPSIVAAGINSVRVSSMVVWCLVRKIYDLTHFD